MQSELSTILPGEGGASSNNNSNRNNEHVNRKYPSNQLIFVGKGNPVPSKYIIVCPFLLFFCFSLLLNHFLF